MSSEVEIPQWVQATATRFCGGLSIGLVTPEPCYQINAGRGGSRYIALTEKEAEAVCKAVLKDIRENRKSSTA